jgi:hypothetical protein
MKSNHPKADYFFELETALHKKQVRNSPPAVSQLLADEFVEFGSSGKVYDKHAIIEALSKETDEPQITVEQFAVRDLAPGVVLVTYKSMHSGSQLASALRSSIWKQIGGEWQMVFHQGTRIPHS